MRRRLKTTKNEKKNITKTSPKKAPSKKPKKEESKEQVMPKNKGVSVRVIGKKKEEKETRLEAPVKSIPEKNIEAELERRRIAAAEAAKPAFLRGATTTIPIQASPRDLDKQKQVIMWSGITFCMILIAFFWLNSTRRVVEESGKNMQEKGSVNQVWDDAVDELSDKISEMQNSVDSINSFGKVTPIKPATTTPDLPILSTASSSASTSLPVLNKEEFEKIDQKVNPQVKEKIRFIY